MNRTPDTWIAHGYEVRQRGGRMIAYCGPHHTPPHEYPLSCRLQDEENAVTTPPAPVQNQLMGLAPSIGWAPSLSPAVERALDEQDARIDHCWKVVRSLRPCACGYDTMKIEPCVIECEHCGRGESGLNWDEVATVWNEGLADGPAPHVEGWV